MGPPCSTWVFMSRGTTGRPRLRIRGSKYFRKVKEANRFVRRMLYILKYAVKKEIHFVIEQPVSSLMPMYRPLKRFLERHGAIQVSVPLGQFGSLSETLGVQFILCLRSCMLSGLNGLGHMYGSGFTGLKKLYIYIYRAFACMRALPGERARAGRWPFFLKPLAGFGAMLYCHAKPQPWGQRTHLCLGCMTAFAQR